MSRRPARGQKLPPDVVQEIKRLHSTSPHLFRKYLASLYQAGWTLRALGEAFNPPIARTTIREWVISTDPTPPGSVPPAHVPTPELRTPDPTRPRTYDFTPKPPPPSPISAGHQQALRDLLIDAKRYRSGMHPASIPAQSNRILDEQVRLLKNEGHTADAIAEAIGVSVRTIYKRLEKTES